MNLHRFSWLRRVVSGVWHFRDWDYKINQKETSAWQPVGQYLTYLSSSYLVLTHLWESTPVFGNVNYLYVRLFFFFSTIVSWISGRLHQPPHSAFPGCFFPPLPTCQPKMFPSEILFDNSFCLSAHHSRPHRATGMSDTHFYIIHHTQCSIIPTFYIAFRVPHKSSSVTLRLNKTRQNPGNTQSAAWFFKIPNLQTADDFKGPIPYVCSCKRPFRITLLLFKPTSLASNLKETKKKMNHVLMRTHETAPWHCFSRPPGVFIGVGPGVGELDVYIMVCF